MGDQFVTWEVLPGLLGDGPVPYYFHVGRPTPWSEGVAIRFTNANGTFWVGNFQAGWGAGTQVIAWPEAHALAVVANDDFYLVNADDPAEYATLGAESYAINVLLAEDRTKLFIAESGAVYAFGRDRQMLWQQTELPGTLLS